jgi:AsnC-like helix-turn-helix protein
MLDEFLLIQTGSKDGRSSVSRALDSLEGVISTTEVSGPFDLIARVQLTDDGLGQELLNRIRSLAGVVRAIPAPVETAS